MSAPESRGTRSMATMRVWAQDAPGSQLRAVGDEARRNGDRVLSSIIEAELRRRGLGSA